MNKQFFCFYTLLMTFFSAVLLADGNYTHCINECELDYDRGQEVVEDMIYKENYQTNSVAVIEKSKLVQEKYNKCLENCEKTKKK